MHSIAQVIMSAFPSSAGILPAFLRSWRHQIAQVLGIQTCDANPGIYSVGATNSGQVI
jgi:hypothetical protein